MAKDAISQAITAAIVAVIAGFLGVLAVFYAVQAAAVALRRTMPMDAALGVVALSLAASAVFIVLIWRWASARAAARRQEELARHLSTLPANKGSGAQMATMVQALHTATATKPVPMLFGAALIGLAAGLAPDQVQKVARSLRSLKTD